MKRVFRSPVKRKGRTSPTEDLEKGQRRPGLGTRRQSTEGKQRGKRKSLGKEESPNDRSLGTRQSEDEKSPFAAHCQPDAKIWQLYLKEAEIEDKEITGIWNDSLDSLLVFAGLFAGVLTAFLIESLKGLNEDPQEALLQKIADLLSNASDSSSSQTFQPDPSSRHVNTLWIISLTLTLLSALGAVLAKGWTAKYNPASYREQLSDACERMLRANRAQEWRLETIITGIPLLIQASLFLFFSGLLIQIIGNDIQIWLTAVILIGFAGLFYIIGTILPWFSPACPFQTPISNFLPGGTSQGRYRDPSTGSGTWFRSSESWQTILLSSPRLVQQFWNTVRKKPTQQVLRGQILSWTITNSTKQETIEEAMKAVAGSEVTTELQNALVQYGADDVLRRKLRECVRLTPGLPKAADDISRLEYLLYANLQLEEQFPTKGETFSLNDDSLLQEGQALHRWDDFPSHLQALAFSLRVHMLINRGRDDHEENWTQTVKSLRQLAEAGSPPNIRNILFHATIRGIVSGQKVLRKMCGHILSGQILIPDVRESLQYLLRTMRKPLPEKGKGAMSTIHEELAEFLAQSCTGEDEDGVESGIKMLIKIISYGVFPILVKYTMERIVKGFGNENRQDRVTTMRILEKLVECEEARDAVKPAASQLVALLKGLNIEDLTAIVSTIEKLADHAIFHNDINSAISQLINRIEDPDIEVRMLALSTLKKLASHATFYEAIKPAIPQLIILLEDSSWETRQIAASTFGQLVSHVELHDEIKPAASQLTKLLSDSEDEVRRAAISAIVPLVNHSTFREAISPVVPELISQLEDKDGDVRRAAASTIGKLANFLEYQRIIKSATLQIINLLKDSQSDVREATASTIGQLANQAIFHDDIKAAPSQLIKLLDDPNRGVRNACVSAILQFANYATFYEDIKAVIPQLIILLGSSYWNIRQTAASTIGQLANHEKFHDDIKSTILQLIKLLEDSDNDVRTATVLAITRLASHSTFQETIKPVILQFVPLLRDPAWEPREAATSAFGQLASQELFHDDIKSVISQLINLFKDSDYDVRKAAVSSIGQLATHAEFNDAIKPAALPLINLLDDSNNDVCSAASLAIENVAYHVNGISSVGIFLSMVSSQLLVPPDKYPTEDRSRRPFISQLLVLFRGEQSQDRFDGIQTISRVATTSRKLPWLIVNTIWKIIKLVSSRERPNELDITGNVKIRWALSISMLRLTESTVPSDESLQRFIPIVLPKLAEDAELRDIVRMLVPRLVNLLGDSAWNNRQASARAIGQLATHKTFHDGIKPAISQLINLLKDSYVCIAAQSAIAHLVKHEESWETIKNVMPQIINLLEDSAWEARQAAASVLGNLANYAAFQDDIKHSILQLANLLKDPDEDVRRVSMSTLGQIARHSGFHGDIKSIMLQPISLLEDTDTALRGAAATALGQLANYEELHDDIKPTTLRLIKMLEDSDREVRGATAAAVLRLASHVTFHEAIRLAIPQLTILLGDSSWIARRAAASTIGQLAERDELRDDIKPAVLQVVGLIGDDDNDVRKACISTIAQLVNHGATLSTMYTTNMTYLQATFHDDIQAVIPQLVNSLKDPDDDVRKAAVSVLGQLADRAEFHETMKSCVLQLINTLEDTDSNVREGVAYAIGHLAKCVVLHDAIKSAVPQLVHLLEDPSGVVSATASSAISMMVQDANLPFFTLLSVGHVVSLLRHNVSAIRANAAKLIEEMLKHDHTHKAILETSLRSNLVELLQDRNVEVLKPLVRIFAVLVNYGYMSKGVVNAVLNAIEQVDDPTSSVQRCGAAIISGMASSVRLRNIFIEVGTIHASLRLFANASAQEASTIIQRMEYFGVLKDL